MSDETSEAAIVAARRARDGTDTALFAWQARMTATPATAPGFFCIEFIPVVRSPRGRQMVLQFRDAQLPRSNLARRAEFPCPEINAVLAP
jgi:hypothetical protein